ncbi:hypothetical protein CI238_09676 [Colletotrichum incanum]|uniref:Uncharacterized protein n=1 Tax=Colletotrichum incanum TaxID=1573173 RepID=A0A161WYT2_COLIC|nr:hypothetical protein CI238_09676 [Colletotrichum incanum]
MAPDSDWLLSSPRPFTLFHAAGTSFKDTHPKIRPILSSKTRKRAKAFKARTKGLGNHRE